jgi:hypothetical protein
VGQFPLPHPGTAKGRPRGSPPLAAFAPYVKRQEPCSEAGGLPRTALYLGPGTARRHTPPESWSTYLFGTRAKRSCPWRPGDFSRNMGPLCVWDRSTVPPFQPGTNHA